VGGELVAGPVFEEVDPARLSEQLWLAVPKPLRSPQANDPTTVKLESRRGVRFFFRGDSKRALQHVKDIAAEVQAAGQTMSDKIWITPLSLWRDSPNFLAEYWVELK
jgi:hypothetical protein